MRLKRFQVDFLSGSNTWIIRHSADMGCEILDCVDGMVTTKHPLAHLLQIKPAVRAIFDGAKI